MNKLLIVVLAMCLVSIHGFVRREAPASDNPSKSVGLEDLQKQIQEAANKLKEFVNPDQIKKVFDDALNGLGKGVEEFKKNVVPPKSE